MKMIQIGPGMDLEEKRCRERIKQISVANSISSYIHF